MKPLLNVLRNKNLNYVPTWFMRQAGRYLPEYRKTRNTAGSFLNLCYSPKLACEVTLQPIHRFNFDGSIIFSDILVIPHALGFSLNFQEWEGPVLEKLDLQNYKSLKEKVSLEEFKRNLSPVYEAIHLTRQKLPDHITLLGFAGAPWTLACYMLQGKRNKNFFEARRQAALYPEEFKRFMDDLSFFIAEHLKEQVHSGADAVQLFDSWADDQDTFSFPGRSICPVEEISKEFKKFYPDTPFIHFPRKSGVYYDLFNKIPTIDAISVDEVTSLTYAKKVLNKKVIQGNLSPITLVQGGNLLRLETEKILSTMKDLPFVFNLGHGIDQHTPIDHVKQVLDCVQKHNKRFKKNESAA